VGLCVGTLRCAVEVDLCQEGGGVLRQGLDERGDAGLKLVAQDGVVFGIPEVVGVGRGAALATVVVDDGAVGGLKEPGLQFGVICEVGQAGEDLDRDVLQEVVDVRVVRYAGVQEGLQTVAVGGPDGGEIRCLAHGE